MKTKKLLMTLTLNGLLVYAFGQQRSVVCTGGEWLANASLSLSFTIGEAVIGTLANQEIIFTQGFQQPERYRKTISDVNNSRFLQLSYYPNPVIDKHTIQVDGGEIPDLEFEVYDVLGRAVHLNSTKSIGNYFSVVHLNFEQLPGGVYIIKITSASQQINTTYKITKVN